VTRSRTWVRALTVLAAVLLVVSLGGLVLHFTTTSWQPVIAVTSGARMAMWFALPALAVALTARQWLIAAIAAAAVVLGVMVQLPYYLPSTAAGRPRLTVLQANLKLGAADPAAVVRCVRTHAVDLLATEEVTAGEQQRLLAAGLGTVLPHRYTRPSPGGSGLGIWSRFPLADQQSLPGFELGVLHARVAAPSGDLIFAAVHLLPPYPYPPDEWLAETARLHRVIADLGRPAVIAGDFNATVDHTQFRALLTRGYADAARQAGAGYLATYPADRWFGPVIGIDHVLSRGAAATSVRTVDLPGSDHRGVLAQIAVTSR
jgi:endonuclease/exonuclease/phosphatase (EEP) superfamily protein YafD